MEMDNIGAEVGQKMRSAVKAKLMELGCYVDDELPDYIMVMVANKRTKSQMNHDLELFLNTKTSSFVDWLHIVLKKLEEITVTNPQVLKRVSKRKSVETVKAVKVKKEKKDKEKSGKKQKKKDVPTVTVLKMKEEPSPTKLLTDEIPVKANKLSEVRKIVIMKDNNGSTNNTLSEENVIEDNFDIPPLSEVSNENELADIEKKIRGVKSRLGIQVASGSEDEDYINLKADPDDLFSSDTISKQIQLKEEILRKISILDASSSEEKLNNNATVAHFSEYDNKPKNDHPRIIFANENLGTPVKKASVLERLGKRPDTSKSDISNIDSKRKKLNLAESRKVEEESLGVGKASNVDGYSINSEYDRNGEKDNKRLAIGESPRESALKRLGVMSKVAIPHKELSNQGNEEEAEDLLMKDVPSAVKVKPRALLPSNKQANKNLLLKAVAEAQRSIAQTPVVGNNKLEAIYTKKYKEKLNDVKTSTRKLSLKDKNNLRNILVNAAKHDKKELDFSSDDDNLEYIPKPIKHRTKPSNQPEYIPSFRDNSSDNSDNGKDAEKNSGNSFPKQTKNQTFIITLDGISRNQKNTEEGESRKRKPPSPIIFNSPTSSSPSKVKPVPDKLPSITSQPLLKTREKCKYWPACRQGEKCEFIHPNTQCRAFPQCKFGEKCLYIHPTCKFETSCTRKDCPYSHTVKTSFSNVAVKTPTMCKFYPNCSNIHCLFYHPKPCKYGKNCKNPLKCTFSHNIPTKSSLTWRSKIKS